MTTSQRQLKAAGLAVVLVLSVFTGATMAAAPTVDSEATDTSTESEWTDGTTEDQFNASANDQSYIEASFDSQSPAVEIIDPDSGVVHAEYDNSSLEQTAAIDSDSDGTDDTWYYGGNVSHDDLATVPMDAGAEKNVTVSFINDTTAPSPDRTNITVTLNNTNERAVAYLGPDATTSGLADIESDEPLIGILASATDIATVEQDNVGIAGDETTVTVVYGNSEVASPFEAAADNKSRFFGLSSTDYEAADPIKDQQVIVSDTHYVTYSEQAPDAVQDNEDATYGVYETVNGESAHRIELGEDYADDQSVTIETVGNEKPGFTVDVVSFEDGYLASLLG